ncbi:IS1634 family transposase [Thermodesulfobacteriota bacterium]
MFFRRKKSGKNEYLQIVENRWEGGASKQRVIATVGRLDRLRASGRLDRLLASGAKFSESVMVIEAHSRGDLPAVCTRHIGPGLIFERLWKETGLRSVVEKLLHGRKYEFPVERAIFPTVVKRLFGGGSDGLCEKWASHYRIDGIEELDLHHLYRAMAWLGEELPEGEQTDHTFSPRCTKDLIEEELFFRTRDLFSSLDLVFFDTTSIYFEGQGGQSIGRRGHNKDHRPDLKQMVLGAVIDGDGRPICCEMWPGNTADVTTLLPVAKRLSSRFAVGRVCLVADRGMISKSTVADLEADSQPYILGARMRNQKEVKQDVLSRAGRYQLVKSHGARLKVKEVCVEERRYVVCLNEDQAKKDAAARQAIIESLGGALKKGDKSLVGNKGYRKYLRTDGRHFEIDKDKIKSESRFDGKWVLRTNTALPAAEVALKYKQLWMVEMLFRSAKSLLETRPVFHKCDRTIRGHVFCSFLALVLRRALQDRLDAKEYCFEWTDVLQSLDALTETQINHQRKRFILRSEPTQTCTRVFQAVGVAMPSIVRQIQGENTA